MIDDYFLPSEVPGSPSPQLPARMLSSRASTGSLLVCSLYVMEASLEAAAHSTTFPLARPVESSSSKARCTYLYSRSCCGTILARHDLSGAIHPFCTRTTMITGSVVEACSSGLFLGVILDEIVFAVAFITSCIRLACASRVEKLQLVIGVVLLIIKASTCQCLPSPIT